MPSMIVREGPRTSPCGSTRRPEGRQEGRDDKPTKATTGGKPASQNEPEPKEDESTP